MGHWVDLWEGDRTFARGETQSGGVEGAFTSPMGVLAFENP